MAEGNPIPEDIRAGLPPQALSLIEKYDEEFGAGNSISFQVAQSYAATPTQSPQQEFTRTSPRRVPITEGEISSVEADVFEAEFTDLLVNDTPYEEARKKARERVQDESERRKRTTVEGNQVSATTEQDIREAESNITAFRKSLGPQLVTVGRRQREDDLGLPQEEIARLRKQVIVGSKVEARRLAREEGLDYDFDSEAFNSFVDRTSGRLMANSLRDLHSDWFRSAKKSVLKENGLEDAEDFPDTPEGKKMLSEAQGLADDTYNYVVPVVFEDLGDVEVDGVSLVPSGKSGAIRRATERIQKGEASLATKVGMGFYSNWHDFDPGSGEVAETWLGAGIRDIGLVPRAVTYPFIRATTWDMDPETGKPYDKDDPMYRLSEWQEEQLANGNILEKGGAWISGTFFGHGFNLDKNMNTGSVLRDFALSHARGEMSNSDFERLQATRTAQNAGVLPHWWDEVWGIGLEVLAPLETAKLPFMAGRKLSQAGARAGRGIAEAAHFDTVADVMEGLRAASSTTDSLTDALILRKFRRQAYEDLGLPVPPKSPLKGAVSAPARIVDDMAADLSKKLITADSWDDAKKIFSGFDDTHPLLTPIGTAFDGLRELRNLSKLKGQKYINKLDDLEKTKAGRRLLAEVRAAGGLKALRPGIPDDVMAFNVVQGLMNNDLSKLVANHIPNNFVFATDTMIVRRGVWLENQKAINKKVAAATDGKFIKNKDGVFFKFDKPEEAASAMRRAFDETDLSNAHRKLIKDIDRTGLVPKEKYGLMHSLAKESIVLDELPVGAFSVKEPMDLARARASSLSTNRAFTKARWVEDIAKGTRAFFKGDSDYRFVVTGGGVKRSRLTGRDLFRPSGEKFLSDTPIAFKKWHTETINKLNQAGRQAEDLLREANRVADPEEAIEVILNISRGESSSIQSYEDIVNIFFAPLDGSLTTFFGRNFDLEDLLKSANLPDKITVEGIKEAIGAIRRVIPYEKAAALERTALKEQVIAGIGLTGKDNIGALMSAYITKALTDNIFAKATKELVDEYPNIVLKVPDGADGAARSAMFRDIALTQGIDPKIVDDIMPNIEAALDANNAHRQSIANAVVMHIFKEGNLATGDDLDRIYDATMGSVGRVVGKNQNLKDAYDPSILFIHNQLKVIAPDEAEELMRLVVPAYIKSVANIDMNSVRAQFSALGVSGRRGEVTLSMKQPVGLSKMDFGHGTIMYDDRLKGLANSLAEPMKRSAVLDQMERLRPAQRKTFDWLSEILSTTRKTTISGILGGFPLPGTRFLGTNALTNPFIVAITAPEMALTAALKTPSAAAASMVRAFRRSGFIAGDRAYDPLKMMYMGDETAVMFKSADGKMWTKGMFEESVAKNNIRFSQATFEFGFDSFQDVMRASKLGPDGKPLRMRTRVPGVKGPPSPREYWEFLRPDKKNVWTMMAEEMDNLQREAVFAQALKSGMKEADAAALSRASLLDYGSTPEWVRQKFAKHMAFVGFRYNMMVETMGAFMRDGRALNNMARQMNFINVQRKDMEEWVLDPDWVKTRFWKKDAGKFREWHSSSLGPGVPFADSFATLTNIGSMIMDRKLGDSIGVGGAALKVTEELFGDPRIQQVLDILHLKGDSNAPDGYMPVEYLAAFEYFGAGDMLVDLFNLEIVNPERARPDIGTYNGNQYQFRDEDSSRMFKLFQLGLLTTGINRNMRDYPRALAGVGIGPDSVEFAKGAEGGAAFWFGGSIASRRDAAAAVDYINNNYVRHMKSGLRRQSFR
tara:strand:- start:2112 stop:7364 length:5253 start_codon:yes stop_codon:yes gene_type:complete